MCKTIPVQLEKLNVNKDTVTITDSESPGKFCTLPMDAKVLIVHHH